MTSTRSPALGPVDRADNLDPEASQWPRERRGRAISRSAWSISRFGCFPATDAAATVSFNQLHRECGVAHSAEALVPDLPDRGRQHRPGQGLRVREGPLRHHRRRRPGQGPPGLDARHQRRPVHRRGDDRSGLRREAVLPGARWQRRRRGVCRHARGHGGEGRRRQARDSRPRVPGGDSAARNGPGHVHAAPRERGALDGRHRRAEDRARQDPARTRSSSRGR